MFLLLAVPVEQPPERLFVSGVLILSCVGTKTLSFECERPVAKTFKISESFPALFKQEIFILDDGNQFFYY